MATLSNVVCFVIHRNVIHRFTCRRSRIHRYVAAPKCYQICQYLTSADGSWGRRDGELINSYMRHWGQSLHCKYTAVQWLIYGLQNLYHPLNWEEQIRHICRTKMVREIKTCTIYEYCTMFTCCAFVQVASRPSIKKEAEFWDVIGTKVRRVFLLANYSHIY